ncbi:chloroplast sensor kinase, chloroplastic isoform X4 [Diospyros lotus]|uniref:chloroplast sensor kinase, chloroplastic isoform X4 n=1 Tax=Diospyros lotus TaxID=55363 RepID=UPI00225B8C61|nr:chloroplast sensor kinase, chloroplastic isoform X4 [Diospyros lotus]
MLLSAVTPPLSSSPTTNCNNSNYLLFCSATATRAAATTSAYRHPPVSLLTANASSSSSLANPSPLRHVCVDESESGGQDGALASSTSAVASAIRRASTSPVEFAQRIESDGKHKGLILPSPDFQRLCLEQLDLFRRIVHPDALLSVFVRPAGSYVMDRLELRQVAVCPGVDAADIVILIGNFSIPTGLRAAEAAISNWEAEFIPECRAVVFPMVKHPFVVGFLVAEFPDVKLAREGHDMTHCPLPEESFASYKDTTSWEIQAPIDNQLEMYKFTAEQRLNATNISRSLAMAYIMDQIRGPLSSIRTLSKMLSLHVKRSEANIVQYNEDTLQKMQHSSYAHPGSTRSQLSTSITGQEDGSSSCTSTLKDLEIPMPPLALAPLQQQGIRRPCNVSDVLADLVGAVEPLACKQQRFVELGELSQSLPVAVEEPALRQALSNLIEGALLRTRIGGKVEIVSTGAPAGGALVMIDDDGPDMHYMTQMHSLTPFGAGLFSQEMVEDNMTWNFVAGLTVAREILESYGCVVRVISPRRTDAALGAGGTRVELWLPSFSTASDLDGSRLEPTEAS